MRPPEDFDRPDPRDHDPRDADARLRALFAEAADPLDDGAAFTQAVVRRVGLQEAAREALNVLAMASFAVVALALLVAAGPSTFAILAASAQAAAGGQTATPEGAALSASLAAPLAALGALGAGGLAASWALGRRS